MQYTNYKLIIRGTIYLIYPPKSETNCWKACSMARAEAYPVCEERGLTHAAGEAPHVPAPLKAGTVAMSGIVLPAKGASWPPSPTKPPSRREHFKAVLQAQCEARRWETDLYSHDKQLADLSIQRSRPSQGAVGAGESASHAKQLAAAIAAHRAKLEERARRLECGELEVDTQREECNPIACAARAFSEPSSPTRPQSCREQFKAALQSQCEARRSAKDPQEREVVYYRFATMMQWGCRSREARMSV